MKEYVKTAMSGKTTRTMNLDMNSQLEKIKKFSEKYDKTDSCWLWKSSLDKDGYGVAKFNYKSYRSHRLMWIFVNGEIPESSYVLHKCDIKNCVNPEHLFLGTQKDNVHDCINKKRFTTGEKNGQSKLTANKVKKIRALYGKYGKRGLVQRELAEMFCVSRVLISDITRGKTWKHI